MMDAMLRERLENIADHGGRIRLSADEVTQILCAPEYETHLLHKKVKVFCSNNAGAGWWGGILWKLTDKFAFIGNFIIAIQPGMYIEEVK